MLESFESSHFGQPATLPLGTREKKGALKIRRYAGAASSPVAARGSPVKSGWMARVSLINIFALRSALRANGKLGTP